MSKKGSATKESLPTPPTITKKPAAKRATEGTRRAKEVEPKGTATKTPTKKVTNGKTKIPVPTRATPPTESSAEPENKKANSISPTNNSTEIAKLAENSPAGVMRKRTRDAVEIDAVNGKEVVDTKHKKAKTVLTTTRGASSKRKGARKYTPFTFHNVEAWFEMYQDEEKDQVMSPAACNQWLEELGISAESAAFYVLAWKLGAKTIFTLTREEFVGGMKRLEYGVPKFTISKIILTAYPAELTPTRSCSTGFQLSLTKSLRRLTPWTSNPSTNTASTTVNLVACQLQRTWSCPSP